MQVEGAEIVEDGLGGFDAIGPDGVVILHSPGAAAWDANTDKARTMPVMEEWLEGPRDPGKYLDGLPIPGHQVQQIVNQAADSGLVPVADLPEVDGDRVRVGLGLPDEWVESPSTVFPVVIDPSASLSTPYWDTYVKSTSSSDFSLSSELLVGYEGAAIFRTLITWNVSTMKGRDVTWAGMYLYNHHSWSCNPREWRSYDIGGEVVAQARNWGTQPWSASYGPYVSATTVTTGYENGGCYNAWIGINITDSAIRWSDFPSGSNLATVAVRAANEGDVYSWKRFYSSNTSYDPYVSYTYNTIPATPTSVSIDGTALTADLTLTANQVADGVTVSAPVSDPDDDPVRALFTVKQDGIVIVDSLPGSVVDSGSGTSSVILPYVLASGVEYTIEVRATDDRLVTDAYGPEYWFTGPATAPRELSPEDDANVDVYEEETS